MGKNAVVEKTVDYIKQHYTVNVAKVKQKIDKQKK